MISLKKIIVLILILSAQIGANCQNVPNLKMVTGAKDFKLQERVLLVLDQELYLAGETVNFMAATLDAGLHLPVDFSSILYMELFDQNNNVISARKLLLNQGVAINSMEIPRDTKTGYYYLRAYTNYMKNFGPGAFFTKRIKVVNPFYSNSIPGLDEIKPTELNLGISVEGGNLVYGIESKVVFYSPNFNERVLARLYQNDIVVAETETKNGVGKFIFVPLDGNKYRIEAVSATGKIANEELKNIVHSGITCKLDSIKDDYCYLKVISKNFNQYPVSVLVENNGIAYEYPQKVNDSLASFKMRLPVGLNRLRLMDAGSNEVSARLVYVKPEAKIKMTASFDKSEVVRGDSVVLNLSSATDDSIQYLVALNLGNTNTSVSIDELMELAFFTSSVAQLTDNFVLGDPGLIGGDVNQMNDYVLKFQNTGVASKQHKSIQYLPEFAQDLVSGSVKAKDNTVAVGNKTLYLAFVDSVCWINRGQTDSLGTFTAALPLDYQSKDLVISVMDTLNDYTVSCDEEFYPEFLKVMKEDFFPDSSLKPIIEARMVNLQINDAYDEMNKVAGKSDRSPIRFYGLPNTEYKYRKYLNLPNLEEFLFEIVKEVYVEKKGTQINFKVIIPNNDITKSKPLVIFDGVPLLENHHLSPYIPTEKMESIRILTSKFYFGSEVFDGIIDITSNDKSFGLVDKDKNSTRVRFSPVVTSMAKKAVNDPRVPHYASDIAFSQINSVSGKETIKIGLPNNSGTYTLSLFGYKKNGEWGGILLPDRLIIK